MALVFGAPNDQCPSTNDQENSVKQLLKGQKSMIEKRNFDLGERTAQFGEATIRFCLTLKKDVITSPLIRQLVRSSTSVGENYLEADEAGSKKEFRYRISVSKRETKETQHWLRMLVAALPNVRENAAAL